MTNKTIFENKIELYFSHIVAYDMAGVRFKVYFPICCNKKMDILENEEIYFMFHCKCCGNIFSLSYYYGKMKYVLKDIKNSLMLKNIENLELVSFKEWSEQNQDRRQWIKKDKNISIENKIRYKDWLKSNE